MILVLLSFLFDTCPLVVGHMKYMMCSFPFMLAKCLVNVSETANLPALPLLREVVIPVLIESIFINLFASCHSISCCVYHS